MTSWMALRGRVVMGGGVWKQDNETRREIDDFFNSKYHRGQRMFLQP